MLKLIYSQPKWLVGLVILVVAALLFGGCAAGNRPTVISRLTATPEAISQSGSTQIECVAQDPDGDFLIYTWLADKGSISGKGSVVTWTAPDAPGAYTITVRITDGRGGEVTGELTISVTENHAPVIDSLTVTNSVSKERAAVGMAKTANIKCVASDPDGDKLSYVWSAKRGNISGQGSTVTWTAPNTCGNFIIAVTVADGKGGEVSEELEVEVIKPG